LFKTIFRWVLKIGVVEHINYMLYKPLLLPQRIIFHLVGYIFSYRRYISLWVLAMCIGAMAWGQSPKREFRGAWIATVSNIDWPSKPGLPAEQQKSEFIKRLDQLKALGCNAVIVQVRPACDAFYASVEEPWSRYLTGKQGQPPFPYYDPLTFMVEEAHKRNMEFHAWFNPYRALVIKGKNPNPPEHVTNKHPDWLINYGTKTYLNPGLPQVREYVTRVIMDVVKRYDIDAVHLDDYFYPYRIANVEFGDQATYNKYGKDFDNKDDWRRNNVDLFISVLNTNIKQVKPWVKLGISPFGVWRNASKDPRGSNTRGGQTCYDDLYSDVLLWMEQGWIDYLAPQLYWEHGHRLVGFEVLQPWWEQNRYNRHMYYGLGVYRMLDATRAPWNSPDELMSQLRDTRYKTKTPGTIFYSTSNFDKISRSVSDSVARFNMCYAFPPQMKWLDSIPPTPPTLTAEQDGKGILLKWFGENPTQEPLRFAVYRFEQGERPNLNKAENIISVLQATQYFDPEYAQHPKCSYIVTALDRLWNESPPSNMVTTPVQ